MVATTSSAARDRHARAPRRADEAPADPRARPRRRRRPRDRRRHRRSRARTRRSRSPSEHDGVYAVLGIHPHNANEPDARPARRAARAARAPDRAVAVGETGLDYFREYAPHDEQRRLFERAARDRRRARQAGRDPHARRRRGHARRARRHRRHRRPPLLLVAGLLEPALERGWYVSFAGNVTYPKAPELREAARRVPPDRILAETDSPYLAPQPVRGKPNEPANVDAHARRARRGPRRGRRPSSRGRSTPTPPLSSACESRAKKQLGQHFLVDENILGVIGRLADLEPDDVVLEVGPGLGMLTRYLAERVAHVHAVELDRSLEPHLRDVAAHDPPLAAMRSQLDRRRSTRRRKARREPPLQHRDAARGRESRPHAGDRRVVRHGAARGRRPFLRRAEHEGLRRRVRAGRARHRRTGFHAVSREVFRPRPNVASALVAFERTAPGVPSGVKRVVEGAFAHRRKTLANSLALAGVATREQAAAALEAIGRDPRRAPRRSPRPSSSRSPHALP